MKQNIFSRVTNGQLSDDAELRYLTVLATNEGKDIRITIERKRKQRSMSQNAYYFGVVVPLVQAMLVDYGNDVDPEETHAFLKEHVGKLVSAIADKDGKRIAIVKSSATLSTVEWEAYMERIKRWAAENGTFIPDPGRQFGE